jgi:2-polyprenyl-3-methyl-5-hydroxy-6-metoxy-1,4-benzoquinol methylase
VTEYRLFENDVPYVSTAAFHADRERAPHLEQEWHQPRLHKAAEFVRQALSRPDAHTVSDLGCGDGGLLSLIRNAQETISWGYDFCPANAAGWEERGVTAYVRDVFADLNQVLVGDVVVMTETLEHLADPHGVLRHLRDRARYLVCSSPWNENQTQHCDEHAWAWDRAGYADLVTAAGWTILRHEQAGLFQVVLAE